MRTSTGAAAATSLWLGAVLALAAFSLMVVPVLAPALAAESDLPAAFVGAYSTAAWAAAIVSSPAAPALLLRFGAWRLSQGCLLLCAAGVVAMLEGSAWGLATGAVLASVALPLLALLTGWRTAALLAAALAAAGALLLAVLRRRHPLPRSVTVAGPGLGALVLLRRSPVLRSLAGRLLWGWVGLRPGTASPLVAALGLGMVVCAATLSLCDASTAVWTMWTMWTLAAVFGPTASGWNGLFLAEVARQSPPQQAGAATAGVLVVMTMGLVVGPLVFSAVASASTFAQAFGVLAGVSMAGVVAQGLLCPGGALDHLVVQGQGVSTGLARGPLPCRRLDARAGPGTRAGFMEVAVFRFEGASLQEHYHLPIKFTAWGYALFRGS